jgi:hypothetical protein
MVPYYFTVAIAAVLALLACTLLSEAASSWHSLRRDRVRFRFFAARDRLYLLAARGVIPVGSKPYVELMKVINLIVHHNEIVGAQVFLQVLESLKDGTPSKDRHGINSLPPAARTEAQALVVELGGALCDLMAVNSNIVRALLWLDVPGAVYKQRRLGEALDVRKEVCGLEQRISHESMLTGAAR